MKKTILSMAVAAAVAAPAAATADAILYGKLHMTLDYADVRNAAALPTYNPITGARTSKGMDFKGWGMNGDGQYMPGQSSTRGNRIGVRGSEDLGNGLKAIYQIEFGVDLTANNNSVTSGGNTLDMRNSFAGLETGFGSVIMGRIDSPLRSVGDQLHLFNDTMADYAETVELTEWRLSNTVAYMSPNWSGLQLMGSLTAPGSATADGAVNVNSDQINGAWALAAIYSNGPFYAAAGYQSASQEMFMNSPTSVAGSSQCRTARGGLTANCDYIRDDFNVWRLAAGIVDWNGFTFGAIYEDQSNLPQGQGWYEMPYYAPGQGIGTTLVHGDPNTRTPSNQNQAAWWLVAGYEFGNNVVKAAYGSLDRKDDIYVRAHPTTGVQNAEIKRWEGDRNTWSIAFDHNLSKRTTAYLLYTAVNDDRENVEAASQWDGFSIGLIHKF